MFIFSLLSQWLRRCHPANNCFLLLGSQIVEGDPVRSEASHKANDVQVNLHFLGAKFDQSVKICKLFIFYLVAAVAQNKAEILKVNKLWKLEDSLVKFILLEKISLSHLEVCFLIL